MSCISFMNGIMKADKENHSNVLSILVYIPDTRVMIYYQYLHGAIDVDGACGHIFYYFLKFRCHWHNSVRMTGEVTVQYL